MHEDFAQQPAAQMPHITAPAARSRRGLFVTVGILIGLLVVAGMAAFFVAPRYLCGLTNSNRQGLACDVPLMSDAIYVSQHELPNDGSGIQSHQWVYRVPNTTIQAIHDAYTQQAPTDGWQCFTLTDAQVFGQEAPQVLGTGLNGNRGLETVS